VARAIREATWLNSTTPRSLLRTLKGKRMPRLRRLFAVACCRRFLDEMPDPESRQAVEVAERFVDGLATTEERETAFRAAARIAHDRIERIQLIAPALQGALWPGWRLAYAAQLSCAPSGMEDASAEIIKRFSRSDQAWANHEAKVHCVLIRDLFGNPFRALPAVSPECQTWNDGAVVKIATAVYADRAFEHLPILADALEEVSCDQPELIEHLRTDGPHARGCWAVDVVLRKRDV
jgi:hypothetical protein